MQTGDIFYILSKDPYSPPDLHSYTIIDKSPTHLKVIEQSKGHKDVYEIIESWLVTLTAGQPNFHLIASSDFSTS